VFNERFSMNTFIEYDFMSGNYEPKHVIDRINKGLECFGSVCGRERESIDWR
jgi:hypothetical protein